MIKDILIAAILALLLSAGPGYGQSLVATPEPRYSVVIATVTPITVKVNSGPGNIRDYVALHVFGQEAYLDWFYLNGTKIKSVKGSTIGTAIFMAPRPGLYSVRFWSLTDAGIAKLIEGVPVSAVLTQIELENVELTVVRKPDSATDVMTLTVQNGKGTLIASQGTPVKVGSKIISPGP